LAAFSRARCVLALPSAAVPVGNVGCIAVARNDL